MSTVEKSSRIDSSTPAGSEYAQATPPQSPDATVASGVYEELERLAELMPQRYRAVFCFRWGLCGEFSHVISQVARKFKLSPASVQEMLTRCLWNVARHAHAHELPALRELLGKDRERWTERAWVHAERRWGNQDSAFSETVLLLSMAGMDVPEAHWAARQHVVELGLGRRNKWPRPMSDDELRQAVDRMLADVIWPATTAALPSLDGFCVRRPLGVWGPCNSGVFQSGKLERLVQFDSDLELAMLRQLDVDPRVVDYREQPVTIPYVLDGEAHEYTPDVIVRLADGRAFIIEAKPRDGLGDFMNWMKWASLARWCERAGLGFWIGSPQRSIIEHRDIQPDPERRELVAEEVQAGPVKDEEYSVLKSLVGPEQLGLTATAELLRWRPDRRCIQQTEGADREEARRFWAVIDQHREARAMDSLLEGQA